MPAKNFYLVNSVAAGSNHGALQDGGTVPTLATTTTGWTVGTEPAGDEASLDWGVEVARTTFLATAMPAATINNTLGDSVRSQNTLSGTFDAGSWSLAIVLRAVTSGGTFDGYVKARLWRGSDATGAGATEIGTLTNGTTVTNLATTADQASIVSWSLGSIDVANEYLFVQMALEVTGAGGAVNNDALLRVGTSGANTAGLVTPNFTAYVPEDHSGAVVGEGGSTAQAVGIPGAQAAALGQAGPTAQTTGTAAAAGEAYSAGMLGALGATAQTSGKPDISAWSPSPVASLSEGLGDGGGTSSAIDTTGADTIFLAVGRESGATPSISDSKGNTWGLIRTVDSGFGYLLHLYRAKDALVGTGHTVTVSTTSINVGIGILAFAGGHRTAPDDRVNSGSAFFVTTLQPGSITPTAPGTLVIEALSYADARDPSISAPYNLAVDLKFTALSVGVAMAYHIQTAATATNPTWTMSASGTTQMAVSASFKSGDDRAFAGRAGPRGQAAAVKARAGATVGRAGASAQTTGTRQVAATAAGRIGARAQTASGAAATTTLVARFTGVSGQFLDILGPGATAPGNLGVAAAPYTFVALIKAKTPGGIYHGIFQNGSGTGGGGGTGFWLGHTGPLLALNIGAGGDATTVDLGNDQWTLVAIVVRSSSAQARYSYNFATSTWDSQQGVAAMAPSSPTGVARIGNYNDGGGSDAFSEWFDGDMAWMGLWPSDKSNSGASTPADIQAFIDDGPWSQIASATFFIAFDNDDLLDEAGAASTAGRYAVLNSVAVTFPAVADVPVPRPAGADDRTGAVIGRAGAGGLSAGVASAAGLHRVRVSYIALQLPSAEAGLPSAGHAGPRAQASGVKTITASATARAGTKALLATGTTARTTTIITRTAALAQSSGISVLTVLGSATGRAGLKAQTIAKRAVAGTSTARTAAQAQAAAVHRATSATSARAGASAQTAGFAILAGSGFASGHAGLKAQAAATHLAIAAAAARTGSAAQVAAAHRSTAALAGHAGASAQTAGATTAVVVGSVAAHGGTRAQAAALQARTGAPAGHSAARAQTTGIAILVGTASVQGHAGLKAQAAATHSTTAAATARTGPKAQVVLAHGVAVATAGRLGARSVSVGFSILAGAGFASGHAGARVQTAAVHGATSATSARAGATAQCVGVKRASSVDLARAGSSAISTAAPSTRLAQVAGRAGTHASGSASAALTILGGIRGFLGQRISVAAARATSASAQASAAARATFVVGKAPSVAIQGHVGARAITVGLVGGAKALQAQAGARATCVGVKRIASAVVTAPLAAWMQQVAIHRVAAPVTSRQGARAQTASTGPQASIGSFRGVAAPRGLLVGHERAVAPAVLATTGVRAVCVGTKRIVIAAQARMGTHAQLLALPIHRSGAWLGHLGARGRAPGRAVGRGRPGGLIITTHIEGELVTSGTEVGQLVGAGASVKGGLSTSVTRKRGGLRIGTRVMHGVNGSSRTGPSG